MIAVLLASIATARDPALCAEGWCWEWPRSHGVALVDVVALSPKEIIAAGAGGLVLHWHRGRWEVLGALSGPVSAVRATSAADVWVAGDDGLLAHLGTDGWTVVPTGTTADLDDLLVADGRIVAVGGDRDSDRGVIVEGPTGGPLEVIDTDDWLHALTASPEGVFAVGAGPVVLRRTAEGWNPASEALPLEDYVITYELDTAWTDGMGRVWSAADVYEGPSLVFRREPRGWIPLGLDATWVTALGGHPDDPLVLSRQTEPGQPVLHRFDGRRWVGDDAVVPDGWTSSLDAIDHALGTVVVVGDAGMVWRQRKGRWEEISGTTRSQGVLAVADDVAVTNFGSRLERVRGAWTPLTEGVAMPVRATTADANLAVSEGDVVRWDDGVWVPTNAGQVRALAGASPESAWAIGSAGGLLRFDGTTWTPVEGPSDATALWAGVDGTVWAGGRGYVEVHQGTAWVRHELDDRSGAARGIAPTGPSEAWILDGSQTLHHVGATVSKELVPDDVVRGRRIEGLAAHEGELWIVGRDGLVARYAAGAWTSLDVPGMPWLGGVRLSEDEVVVYGRNAILSRAR